MNATTRTHKDAKGKTWTVSYEPIPIPFRGFDWSATDEDYDGAPDSAGKNRVAYGATAEGCIEEIDLLVAEELCQ